MSDNNRTVVFNIILYPDGRIVKEVTQRNDGDCRVLTKIGTAWGEVTSDETTGPFCDRQNEVIRE